MNAQTELEFSANQIIASDDAMLRNLLSSELFSVGGGEVVTQLV
jgi:hypothetical protein